VEILLANPRGFCAGVDRAIEIVERALELFGPPIYVRHEIVHNRFVVDGLRERGAVFVDELDEVPDGATVIFSAHGVAKSVHEKGKARNLQVIDATCPLVTKVHLEVARHAKEGKEVVLIGHAGHPEVIGTLGQYDGSSFNGGIHLVQNPEEALDLSVVAPDNLAYVTQTTLSVDDATGIITALKTRFPNIKGPRKDDICYATQNRQDAVKHLTREADLIIVVGSPNSSNSNRLREIAQDMGKPSYLVDSSEEVDQAWFEGVKRIGVTAGASAPESLVKQLIEKLKDLGATEIRELSGIHENVTFPIPKNLQNRNT